MVYLGMFNNDFNIDADKSFHYKEGYEDIFVVTKYYISTNGFESGDKRKLVLDPKVIKVCYNEIIIRYSYFKQDTSLLKELLKLSFSERSNLLKVTIEDIFNINLAGKQVVMKR